MFHFDWAGWTNWVPLIGLDFTTVPWSPGAYVIANSSPVIQAGEAPASPAPG